MPATRIRNHGRPDPNLTGRPRQRLKAQVRAEEPNCWICLYPIDLSRDRYRDPLASAVDEVIPRAHGGSARDRANTRHSHRSCNGSRGTKPLTPELRARCQAKVRYLMQGNLSRAW